MLAHDFMCDGQNNNLNCGYDGYDCCLTEAGWGMETDTSKCEGSDCNW